MPAPRGEAIPAFLSIDVEPDAFQIVRDDASTWAGFVTTLPFTEALRESLARLSDTRPRFGWYLRMDPQIEQACGRADAVAAAHGGHLADLRAHGDYFGVHMHPLRWCAQRRCWIHDFADNAWLRHCTHFSLDAFAKWSGAPAKLFRAGAGFLDETIVEALDERGVEAEMSLEPVASQGFTESDVASGVDTSPIVGTFTDGSVATTVPFHPRRGDFLRRGADARAIVLVPLSSGPYAMTRSDWWSKAKRTLRRFHAPLRRHLYNPLAPWPSPRYFWDLVAHTLDTMRRPYLSLAIRTDAMGSIPNHRFRAVFDELATHPLGERLRFVDPLDCLPSLMHADAANAPSVRPPVSPEILDERIGQLGKQRMR